MENILICIRLSQFQHAMKNVSMHYAIRAVIANSCGAVRDTIVRNTFNQRHERLLQKIEISFPTSQKIKSS